MDPNVQALIDLVAGLHGRMDRQDVELAEIKAQCKTTNGRIGTLERWRIRKDAIAEERDKRGERSYGLRIALAAAVLGGPATVALQHFAG